MAGLVLQEQLEHGLSPKTINNLIWWKRKAGNIFPGALFFLILSYFFDAPATESGLGWLIIYFVVAAATTILSAVVWIVLTIILGTSVKTSG